MNIWQWLHVQISSGGQSSAVQALEKDIRTWTKSWDDNPRPFTWTKTADQILERLATYLDRIPGRGR